MFHKYLGTREGNSDPQLFIEAARVHLRDTFLTRKAALTGVNFAIAETGEFVFCTNEGNADMGPHFADIHIACMGIEKIIPKRDHLSVILRLLGRSATAQLITTYSSHFVKPVKGKKFHIILVDNGRTKQLGRPDFRNSLKCIRCAACFNNCPVYRRRGVHSYNAVIAGPIGSILSPNLDMKEHADLPFASTLCSSCTNVCLVKIDIYDQLYKWRQVLVKEGIVDPKKALAMQVMAKTLATPGMYRLAGKAARVTLKYAPFVMNNKLNPRYLHREMPEVPSSSFGEWFQKIEINIGMTSREKILLAVNTNQPTILPLINLDHFLNNDYEDPISKFISIAEGIGSKVFKTNTCEYIIKNLSLAFKLEEIRVVSTMPEFSAIAMPFTSLDNHQLADVELMILPGHFAVAENGGCWVSDELFRERVLPFILQHLVIVVNKNNIISTMHQAYHLIGDSHYGFGTFIAGPSKTADVKQSLVLGAHGARSLNVFLL